MPFPNTSAMRTFQGAPSAMVLAWGAIAASCIGGTPPNPAAIVDAQSAAVAAESQTDADAPLPFGPEERREELGFVRDLLRDGYAHLALKERQWGVRLDERYASHLGSIEGATTWTDYAAAMDAFLGGFHDGHLRWTPPTGRARRVRSVARLGIETRLLGGHLFVSEVWPISDARRAGLRVGDEIVAVDGRTVPSLFAESQELESWSRSERARYLFERRWPAIPGASDGGPRRVTLRRAEGAYETFLVHPETEGYYRLRRAPIELYAFETQYRLEVSTLMLERTEVERLMGAVRERLAARPLPLAIDLRGNPGGYDNAARVVAGSFTDRALRGATVRMRLTERVLEHRPAWRDLPADPRAPDWSLPQPVSAEGVAPTPYPAPIAVLVDAGCNSACEILALLLRAQGARLFGTRTAGSSGGPIQVELPHSRGRLSVPVWSMEDLTGRPLEGHGVLPDEHIETTPDDLLAGTDVVLRRSMNWLNTPNSRASSSRAACTAEFSCLDGALRRTVPMQVRGPCVSERPDVRTCRSLLACAATSATGRRCNAEPPLRRGPDARKLDPPCDPPSCSSTSMAP